MNDDVRRALDNLIADNYSEPDARAADVQRVAAALRRSEEERRRLRGALGDLSIRGAQPAKWKCDAGHQYWAATAQERCPRCMSAELWRLREQNGFG